MSSYKEHDLLRQAQGSDLSDTLTFSQKCLKAIANFGEKQLSPGSFVTKWAQQAYEKSVQDARLKKTVGSPQNDPLDFYYQILIYGLLVILLISFFVFPPLLRKIDQFRNDLEEQAKVIRVEELNHRFLAKMEEAEFNNQLQKNMATVQGALPKGDEQAENMIAFLEKMAGDHQVGLDSIGINQLSDSQFYYDEVIGVVQPYEYSFSVQSSLENSIAFLRALRRSLRLMDVVTLSIEPADGGIYQMNVSLFAYHLID